MIFSLLKLAGRHFGSRQCLGWTVVLPLGKSNAFDAWELDGEVAVGSRGSPRRLECIGSVSLTPMRIQFLKTLAALAIASSLFWSSAPSQSALAAPQFEGVTIAQATAADDLPRLDGMATVEMVVNGKTITLELDGTKAPITAGNFADLVQRGFYDGLIFHRVVKEPSPFVAQGGDPRGNGTGGFVDPETNRERNIPLEIQLDNRDEPTYNRLLGSKRPALQHKRGAIAMARSQNPASASSQFYFALTNLEFLDGNYAVFGYVTDGMDVVDGVEQGDRITSAKLIAGADNLK